MKKAWRIFAGVLILAVAAPVARAQTIGMCYNPSTGNWSIDITDLCVCEGSVPSNTGGWYVVIDGTDWTSFFTRTGPDSLHAGGTMSPGAGICTPPACFGFHIACVENGVVTCEVFDTGCIDCNC